MKTSPPTSKEIAELVAFLSRLYADDLSPVKEWRGLDQQPDGSISFPWPEYEKVVKDFVKVAANDYWTDHDYDPEEAGKMLFDENVVKTADVTLIKTMLTFCVRGERLCDGHWETMIEGGHVRRLILRLAEIANIVTRHESARKPGKCPACDSARIARILYGEPALTSELNDDLKAGRLVFGGCCITDDDPA